MTKKRNGRLVRLIGAVTVGLLAVTGLAASPASAGTADPVIYWTHGEVNAGRSGVAELSVACQPGTVPIGYWIFNPSLLPHLERATYTSTPSPGMYFRARTSNSLGWTFNASVLCIIPPAGYEHVVSPRWVTRTGGPATAYATCPAGKSVIGSTFMMMVGSGAWANLQTVIPNTDGQFTKVIGASSNNTLISVLAGSYCADRPLTGFEHVTATVPADQTSGTVNCSPHKAAYTVGIETGGHAALFWSNIPASYFLEELSYGQAVYVQPGRATVVHALCMDYSVINKSTV